MYDYQVETLLLLNQLKELKSEIEEYKIAVEHLEDANLQLIEDSKLLNIITNSSKDLILRHAPDGEILFASPSSINIIGYLPKDLVGKNIYDFIDEDIEEFDTQLQKQLKNNNIKTIRFKIKHKYGDSIWVESKRKVLEKNKNGLYKEVINWICDISEDIQNEENLKDMFRELTSRKSFLSELSDHQSQTIMQLKIRQRKFEELNKLKDRIIAIIAHDLRNPFNNILGITEIVMEEHDSLSKEEILSLCEGVHYSVIKANALLENLVTWAASNQTQISAKKEPVNVKKIVDSCFEIHFSNIKVKEIEIINEIPENLEFKTDPNILSTVLRNLISNAIKYSKKKGMVKVQFTEVEDSYYIDVIDNGVGMTKEDVERINQHYQVESKMGTLQEGGSGLGIAMIMELLPRINGKLFVESELEEGSKFTIEFDKSSVA